MSVHSRLISTSPDGIEFWAHIDGDNGKLTTESRMPGHYVEQILDKNAELRRDGVNKKAIGRHAAEIPIVEFMKWRQEWLEKASKSFTWDEFRNRKLNSYEYSYFRTGVNRL